MNLDELRRALADVDRQILGLVARRQALSSGIGEAKRRMGRPPRDFDQEREVLQRARAAAAETGLSPEVAEEIVLLLIRSLMVGRAEGFSLGPSLLASFCMQWRSVASCPSPAHLWPPGLAGKKQT